MSSCGQCEEIRREFAARARERERVTNSYRSTNEHLRTQRDQLIRERDSALGLLAKIEALAARATR